MAISFFSFLQLAACGVVEEIIIGVVICNALQQVRKLARAISEMVATGCAKTASRMDMPSLKKGNFL